MNSLVRILVSRTMEVVFGDTPCGHICPQIAALMWSECVWMCGCGCVSICCVLCVYVRVCVCVCVCVWCNLPVTVCFSQDHWSCMYSVFSIV